jgi:hypothetical protein
MSHRHFCDYAGHDWQCGGAALRGSETEPSLCSRFRYNTSSGVRCAVRPATASSARACGAGTVISDSATKSKKRT